MTCLWYVYACNVWLYVCVYVVCGMYLCVCGMCAVCVCVVGSLRRGGKEREGERKFQRKCMFRGRRMSGALRIPVC